MVSQIVDPPERLREEAQALAEKIARNSPAAVRATKRALWARWSTGSPTRAAPAPRSSSGCGATPTRRKARWRSPSGGRPAGCDWRRGDVTLSKYDTLKLERHGPVGWLINNRPEQLNAMSSHIRDEFADAWLELDADPAVKVIVHTGEGRPSRPASTSRRSPATASAWSDTASRSRTGTCTSPLATGRRQAGHHAVNGSAPAGPSLGGRGRHRDRGERCHLLDPHVSVGQVVAVEVMALLRKMSFEAVDAHGPGRAVRAPCLLITQTLFLGRLNSR